MHRMSECHSNSLLIGSFFKYIYISHLESYHSFSGTSRLIKIFFTHINAPLSFEEMHSILNKNRNSFVIEHYCCLSFFIILQNGFIVVLNPQKYMHCG